MYAFSFDICYTFSQGLTDAAIKSFNRLVALTDAGQRVRNESCLGKSENESKPSIPDRKLLITVLNDLACI